MNSEPPLNLEQREEQARELLAPGVYDLMAGGAEDELTLADNLAAWKRIRLRPWKLQRVERTNTRTTTILGTPVANLFMIASTGNQRYYHPEGEAPRPGAPPRPAA
jgi:4-hydroxymandelate oxidase